jgi:hypothetical protein
MFGWRGDVRVRTHGAGNPDPFSVETYFDRTAKNTRNIRRSKNAANPLKKRLFTV